LLSWRFCLTTINLMAKHKTVNAVFNVRNNVTLSPGIAKVLAGMDVQEDQGCVDVKVLDEE